MRLLFLSPRECWPPTSGAKLRDYHFARGLAQGCELTYLFFGAPGSAEKLAEQIPAGARVIAVPPPPKYSAAKIVRGVVGRYPLPVQNYTSEAMKQKLSETLRQGEYDLVHMDSIHFAAYLPLLRSLQPRAKVILNWHNIESELMERYAKSTASLPRKIYASVTARQMRTLEHSMLRLCYGHLVCSEREFDFLTRVDRNARIATAPNGVDTTCFSPQAASEVEPRLVFVGQMSYHANASAAVAFARETWPAIRSSHPGFLLSIVGSSPGPAVQALANEAGVDVTGTVPDVRPYYSGAYAAIVPLLTGGGTRLKILEAMAAGTPVISTRIGAEGLPVTDRDDILFAASTASWLDAIDLLADRERRNSIVERARRLAVSQFDWNTIAARILDRYRDWSRE